MAIVNRFPGGGGGSSIDFDGYLFLYTSITREQRYSTSSSATVTNIGYITTTTKNQIYFYATYTNATVGNQTATFIVTEDNVTLNVYSSTNTSGTPYTTQSLTKGHKYSLQKCYGSSSGASYRYLILTDLTENTQIVKTGASNTGMTAVFSNS